MIRLMDTELIMRTTVTVMTAFLSCDERERLMTVITAPVITLLPQLLLPPLLLLHEIRLISACRS